jgi:hypothetical protein
VSDGPVAPAPGACPGCGAQFAGGADTPAAAAGLSLARFAVAGDPDTLARALFAIDTAGRGVAITSDRRDGFYGWWIFVADTPEAVDALRELAGS